MVRARGRQPQHRDADVLSHSHPQTVTSIKIIQPSDVPRSQTADNCKRPRQDRREIRSNETTNEPPQKKRTALEHSGNLGATCSHGQDYVAVGDRGRKEPAGKRMEYECPYCRVTIYSAVESGKVKAVGHCGQQFRVRNGVVARGFAHACPTCGQQIQSAKSIGRIKSTHKRPDGKTCPRTSWVVK